MNIFKIPYTSISALVVITKNNNKEQCTHVYNVIVRNVSTACSRNILSVAKTLNFPQLKFANNYKYSV